MTSGELRRPGRCHQRGFGYLMVLFAIAAMGITLAGAGEVWRTASTREKEAQLLFAGQQFSLALASYRDRSPVGLPTAPATIDELLEDSRFVMPVRHLRRMWRDPLTNEVDWELVKINGRIVAVHSRLDRRPLRTTQGISGSSETGIVTYRDWVFRAEPAK